MESRDWQANDYNLSDLAATTEHTVAGGWLGTYYYDKRLGQTPARFEATFSLSGREGRFDGTILDDTVLGEARALEGIQTGLGVSFVKVYVKPPRGHNVGPVTYDGTLSEDGKRITGKWQLDYTPPKQRRAIRMSGTWEARRLWHDLLEEEVAPEREGLLVGAGTR